MHRSLFKKGDAVEVRIDEAGFHGAWFEATVVRTMAMTRRYSVLYSSLVSDDVPPLPLRERVEWPNVRPCPPRGRGGSEGFEVGEDVEAYFEDGWWRAKVLERRDEGYLARFPCSGEEAVVRMAEVRECLVWKNGEWISLAAAAKLEGELQKKRRSTSDLRSSRQIHSHMTCWGSSALDARSKEPCKRQSADCNGASTMASNKENNSVVLSESQEEIFDGEKQPCNTEVQEGLVEAPAWAKAITDHVMPNTENKQGCMTTTLPPYQHHSCSHLSPSQMSTSDMSLSEPLMYMKVQTTQARKRRRKSGIVNRWSVRCNEKEQAFDNAKSNSSEDSDVVLLDRVTVNRPDQFKPLSENVTSGPPSTSDRAILERGDQEEDLIRECLRQKARGKELNGKANNETLLKCTQSVADKKVDQLLCDSEQHNSLVPGPLPSNELHEPSRSEMEDDCLMQERAMLERGDQEEDLTRNGLGRTAQEEVALHEVVNIAMESEDPNLTESAKNLTEHLCDESEVAICAATIQGSQHRGKELNAKASSETLLPCLEMVVHKKDVLLHDGEQHASLVPGHLSSNELYEPSDCEMEDDFPMQERHVICEEKVVASTTHLDPSSSKDVSVPFSKTSPMWESIKSMKAFQEMPQEPHFHPLEKYCEEWREGIAIGMMVNFANLIDNVNKLDFSDPDGAFKKKLKVLVYFEDHGFDVKAVRQILEGLLQLKFKICTKQRETDMLHKMIDETDKLLEELGEVVSILQYKRATGAKTLERNESEIIKLQEKAVSLK